MTQDDDRPVTREGLFGVLAGRAKRAAGELLGNDHLADEGRLQEAQVEAQAETAADEDD